jgi:diketogulonate reductase-like aldo/keto reductase
MAWVRSKYSAVYPIIGGTSLEQLRSNAEALKITLTPEQVKKLDDASPFDHGFPTGRFGTDPRLLPEQAPQVPLITVVSAIKRADHCCES